MRWVNATQEAPQAREEVLVRANGIYNLAVYDDTNREFTLRNGAKYTVGNDEVEWIRLGIYAVNAGKGN